MPSILAESSACVRAQHPGHGLLPLLSPPHHYPPCRRHPLPTIIPAAGASPPPPSPPPLSPPPPHLRRPHLLFRRLHRRFLRLRRLRRLRRQAHLVYSSSPRSTARTTCLHAHAHHAASGVPTVGVAVYLGCTNRAFPVRVGCRKNKVRCVSMGVSREGTRLVS